MGQHGRLVVAETPFQGEDLRQPLLETGHRAGVVVEAVDERADLGGDVRDLRVQAAQALGEGLEAWVEPTQVAGLPRGGRDALASAGRSSPVPSSSAAWMAAPPRAIASPLRAAPRRAWISSASPSAQMGGGDLAGLVLGEVQPAHELARIDRELGQRRPVRPPALDRPGHRPRGHRMAAVRVEQVALPRSSSSRCWSCWPWISTSPPTVSASRAAVTGSSSRRAVERPPAWTSRITISGSGSRSNSASTRARSAPWRTSPVSARAPERQPEGVDQQALARAGLAGDDVEASCRARDGPGRSGPGRRPRARAGGPPGRRSRRQELHLVAEQVPERHRAGRLDEADRARAARTSTTSPTAIGRSSRPSMLTSASIASTTRAVTVWLGLTTTERMADR